MRSAKVLLVEDDADVREMLQEILELETTVHFEVMACEHGAQAIYALREHMLEPDLIVSDIQMPVMNGYELLAAVRSETFWQHIPILFVTVLYSELEIHRARQMGIRDYIVKPFTVPKFLQAVHTQLEGCPTYRVK